MSGCTFPNQERFKRLSGTPSGTFWTRVKGGELKVDLDDFVGRCAYFVGDLDPKISLIFERLIKPGDHVIDAGANIGLTTLRMASLAGPKGMVHSFEPNPHLVARLTETVKHNNLLNISIYNIALGSEEGQLTLFVPTGNMGGGSTLPNRNPETAKQYDVVLRRLDDVLSDAPALKLIKIDVEGAEANLLKGGARLIEKHRPEAIIFEFNKQDARTEEASFIDLFFSDLDYAIFSIRKSLFTLNLVQTTLCTNAEGHDFCAIPKGERFEEICRTLNARSAEI